MINNRAQQMEDFLDKNEVFPNFLEVVKFFRLREDLQL